MSVIVTNFFPNSGQHGLRTTLFLEETEKYQNQMIDAEKNTIFLEQLENENQVSNLEKAIRLRLEVYQSFLQFIQEKWKTTEMKMNKKLKKIRLKSISLPLDSKMHATIEGKISFQIWHDLLFFQATKHSHCPENFCNVHLQLEQTSLQFNSKLLTLLAENLNELNINVQVWSLIQC